MKNLMKNKKISILINISITILIFAICTAISYLLDLFHISDLNFLIIYVLGVLLTAVFTKGYVYSFAHSIISVFGYNFFFTVPRYTFHFNDKNYWITFILMFAISLVISFVMYQLKKRYNTIAQLNIDKMNLQNESEKETVRATLLRSISHDLRTPLTTIKDGAELVLKNPKIDENDRQKILTDISLKAEWTVRLVENLLSLTRIDNNSLSVKKRLEAVEEVVPQAVRMVKGVLGQRKIHYELPAELLLVPMDATLIMQTISNLLNNAIKHTADNEDIWIKVFSTGKNAIFRISNNGKTIKEVDLPRIFDLYYTTGDSKSGENAGIGLAICKLITSAHGGTIDVSQTDERVTFEFSLPMEEING